MPELPEVETTRRGIEPHLRGRRIANVVVRQPLLREPVPADLAAAATGGRLAAVERRGKYLLLRLDAGTLIVHLGMSGSLRLVPAGTPPGPHDHVDLVFDHDTVLRLRDPRRFGIVTWTTTDPLTHRLLRRLGPEPLGPDFGGAHLAAAGRARRVTVKSLLLDGTVVAGVGNIYANEALYRARIHPARRSGRIAAARYGLLAASVREVLTAAVAAGGTTLRDFTDGAGRPGYFALRLAVYGREGAPCPACGAPVRRVTLGQRSTFYCGRCQR